MVSKTAANHGDLFIKTTARFFRKMLLKTTHRIKMKKQHGGARRNAGRKTEVTGERMLRRSVTLDERTIRLLNVLGDGNLSRGIRAAADTAYEAWQRKRDPH